ncbi:MAG: NAD-glutamate dehydrogenase [Acidobacteriota bacterium]
MRRPEKKRELIDDVVRHVLDRTPDSEHEIARRLTTAALTGVALDDLRHTGAEGLAGVALSLIDLVREMPRDEGHIRIFNPQDEGHHWGQDHTVVEVASVDMPFLVDSFTAAFSRRGLTIHLAVHPQLATLRDDDSRVIELLDLGAEGEGIAHESVMHYQIDLLASQAERVDLETMLHKVLHDVHAAVQDWQTMRTACYDAVERLRSTRAAVEADEMAETIEFLDWVADDHFTFLGYLEYSLIVEDGVEYLRPDTDSGLGLLRKTPIREQASGREPAPPDVSRFLHGPDLVMISKTSQHSTVHRNVHMDVISLKRFGADGEVDGELRFVGLFTSMAYSIAARNIPLVRRKVERVVSRTRFLPASHNVKVLRHIVEHYPRDELFQISEDDLYHFAMRILELQLRPRLALLVRRDEEERFVSCMVYVPRDRHNTEVRMEIQRILEEVFVGEVTAYYTRISDRPLAQLQFIVKTHPGHLPEVDAEALEGRLTEAIKSWPDRLREALDASGSDDALEHWRCYEDAFSLAYQQYSSAEDALLDIPLVERTLASGELGMRFYRRQGALERRFHLRTFERGVQMPLSDFLPLLENMGVEVISELPFEVRPRGAMHPVWIRDFELVADGAVNLAEASEGGFEETLRSVYRGDVESDGFNRLVLRACLECRQVTLLRAYCKYLRQTGIAFSQSYMEQTLASHPEVARQLVELFALRFEPAARDGVAEDELTRRETAHIARLRAELDSVRSLDDDRILRRFVNLITATLRTNYYRRDDAGSPRPYVSFKLDGSAVSGLPKPRPAFEIFVYSPRVEAVHLRGGAVARGGIRWSDRLEDFRTEILGLVKSQMVKNAVIVPVGAKGGFVVKRPPADGDREALRAEGEECYRMLIRGMLDITDNLEAGAVVPPADVVRHDDDDPYLVVAADKGTATFSDLANAVAAEYGFWLGDAFASGGSKGYDHKKMGITARGAWEGVKRHFRERGHDIQDEPFTCVGVGDMSGDVFGNGMLLSEQTRLIAAFNHLHIFVDPDPDPARSFAERQRLFELERSTWDDYNREALSEGGAVFSRSDKRLELHPSAAAALGLSRQEMSPNELIQAILRAKVDLLWFGGIGTYIKASDESHARAGDRANDEIRVDAVEVCCKVIGEGANLGVTQRGRIELALASGRVNTDFIDNSGGVDCSDHEVNIKIALDEAIDEGLLDSAQRDQLLTAMTDEVSRLVLRDNYLQTQAITLVEQQGVAPIEEQMRLMRTLERSSGLDRRLEDLPDDATLAERKKDKRGLTRPEIAVLLAHAKIDLFNQLLESDLPDDPALVRDLVRYFPVQMRHAFRPAIERHRLRREIIATHVTNSIVNRVGPSFIARMAEETGRRVSDVARAYTAARDIFELRALWEEVEALDNQIPAQEQTRILHESTTTLAAAMRWFLRYGGRPLDIGTMLEKYESNIVVVAAQLEDLLPPNARRNVRRRLKRLRGHGVSTELATRLATLAILPSACDVARAALVSGVAVERVGKVYFAVGERFGFDRLARAAEAVRSKSAFHQQAATAILDDLASHQSEITRQVVKYPGRARVAIEAWVASRSESVHRLEELRQDFEDAARVDVAMLTIAERELRRVVSI